MPINKDIPTEDQEQIKLAVWLDKNNITYFAIPNGGRRNYLEAVKFKRMGVKKGVPDLFIPMPKGEYHGLFIELKRTKGGVISTEQAAWLAWLGFYGYKAVVAKGFEEAKIVVTNYLNG